MVCSTVHIAGYTSTVLRRRLRGRISQLRWPLGAICAGAWARSSAWVWRLVDDHPPTPEIVIPWQRRKKIAGVTVHRSRALTADVLTFRDHIRVTNPLVTTIDLGVVLSPVEVGDVIIRARQMKLFEPAAVEATIARLAKPGRTGIVTARAALEMIMIGDRPAESVLEFRFHIGPGWHGLPPYSYQHEVRINNRKYFIDFAYPEVMLAIEVDGYEKRASPRVTRQRCSEGRDAGVGGVDGRALHVDPGDQ